MVFVYVACQVRSGEYHRTRIGSSTWLTMTLHWSTTCSWMRWVARCRRQHASGRCAAVLPPLHPSLRPLTPRLKSATGKIRWRRHRSFTSSPTTICLTTSAPTIAQFSPVSTLVYPLHGSSFLSASSNPFLLVGLSLHLYLSELFRPQQILVFDTLWFWRIKFCWCLSKNRIIRILAPLNMYHNPSFISFSSILSACKLISGISITFHSFCLIKSDFCQFVHFYS